MTKNHIYKYETVKDAAMQILRKDGVRGLYKGLPYFLVSYAGQYSI